MTSDPWAFGWTQLLTIVGFAITVTIAFAGFKTFDRWKREKVEEVRMEIAVEMLALAYQAKNVFAIIRSALVYSYEWSDMQLAPGETDDVRDRRGPYYARLKRIHANKDFFEQLWQLQPKCMAVLGADTEELFKLLHQARRYIEVGCEMLASRNAEAPDPNAGSRVLYEQMRRDIADHGNFEPEKDRVGKMLRDFQAKAEGLCRPIIERKTSLKL
jgi:hypothetical protein